MPFSQETTVGIDTPDEYDVLGLGPKAGVLMAIQIASESSLTLMKLAIQP